MRNLLVEIIVNHFKSKDQSLSRKEIIKRTGISRMTLRELKSYASSLGVYETL